MRELPSMPDKRWLNPADVAEMIGFSESFVRAEIKTGALKATLAKSRSKIRGRWRIAARDARAYARSLGFCAGAIAPNRAAAAH